MSITVRKFNQTFGKFRNTLKERLEAQRNGVDNRGRPLKTRLLAKTNRKKRRILTFFRNEGRWPKRTSNNAVEVELGSAFENYMSKACESFDAEFRALVLATGRKASGKRNHNIKGFKAQILAFIKEHGHIPRSYTYAKIEGEGNLHAKMDYYTREKNDMTFLGKLYKLDKCHKSGVPTKYRALINANMDLDKPLNRLV